MYMYMLYYEFKLKTDSGNYKNPDQEENTVTV